MIVFLNYFERAQNISKGVVVSAFHCFHVAKKLSELPEGLKVMIIFVDSRFHICFT